VDEVLEILEKKMKKKPSATDVLLLLLLGLSFLLAYFSSPTYTSLRKYAIFRYNSISCPQTCCESLLSCRAIKISLLLITITQTTPIVDENYNFISNVNQDTTSVLIERTVATT